MRFGGVALEPLGLRLLVTSVCAALAFLSLAHLGHAANVNNIAPGEDFVVELPFVAKPGDRFLVSYDLSWHQRSKGEAPLQLDASSIEHGEFLAQRSDGYTVRWTTREFSVSTGDNPSNIEIILAELIKTLHELDPNKQTEFSANLTSRPIHVPEWRTMSAFRAKVIKEHLPKIIEKVAPEMTKHLSKQGRMADLIAMLLAKGGGVTFDDGKAAAESLEAAILMAAAQNIGLPRIGKFEWKRSAPILGNEDRTKSTITVWFESFSRQFDVAEIRWRTEFDRADLKNTPAYKDRLAKFLKSEKAKAKVKRLPSIKPEEIVKLANKHLKLERTDEGFAKIWISDGWTQEASYETRSDWSVFGAQESEVYKHRIRVKRLPPN